MTSRGAQREIALYSAIGLTGVGIDIALFLLLHFEADLGKQASNVISITVAITNNFFWNARYTFRVRDRLLRRFVSFYLVGMLGIGITALMLAVCVDGLGWSATVTKIASLPIVLLVQFSLNKYVSFRGNRLAAPIESPS